MEKIPTTDLFQIWANGPIPIGDIISGSNVVIKLRKLGLIRRTSNGYVITSKGCLVIDQIFEHLDSTGVFLNTSIVVGEENFPITNPYKNEREAKTHNYSR